MELSGGSRKAELLVPREGARHAEIRTTPSMLVRLDAAVSGMLDEMTRVARDLGVVAERVSELLDDDKQTAFGNTLANVERLTGTLAERAEALAEKGDRLDDILINLGEVSAALPEVVRHTDDCSAHAYGGAVHRRYRGTIDRRVE